MILLFSASQVAGIIGMSHYPSSILFFLNRVSQHSTPGLVWNLRSSHLRLVSAEITSFVPTTVSLKKHSPNVREHKICTQFKSTLQTLRSVELKPSISGNRVLYLALLLVRGLPGRVHYQICRHCAGGRTGGLVCWTVW
jgi:hypothetical protein